MTAAWSMKAMIRVAPTHCGQSSGSDSQNRLLKGAQRFLSAGTGEGRGLDECVCFQGITKLFQNQHHPISTWAAAPLRSRPISRP